MLISCISKYGVFIFLFLFSFHSYGQSCNVTISASPSVNIECPSDIIQLEAVGSAPLPVVVFADNFDGGVQSAPWTVFTDSDFSNPCQPSLNGTSYCWTSNNMGSNPNRIYETTALDVQAGGEICLDFVMGNGFGGLVCDLPETSDDSISLQFLDVSSVWQNLFVFNPTTASYITWQQYCIPIPVNAQTSSTMFRLYQHNVNTAVGYGLDTWGFDNFEITANVPVWYDWSHISGTTGPLGDPAIVSVDNSLILANSSSNFTVTYTNGLGFTCSDNIQVNYIGMSAPVVSSIQELCGGDDDGSITVVPVGTSPDYIITIDELSVGYTNSITTTTQHTFTNLSPGNYAISIVDQMGCSVDTVWQTINIGPVCCSISATSSVDDISCNGITPCDGEASVSVLGQQGSNNLYQWFNSTTNNPINGATSNFINGLCPGDYHVEITDLVSTTNSCFILNGNASLDGTTDTVILTSSLPNNQSGSSWNCSLGSLLYPMVIDVDLFFGTNNTTGADGIAFVLQQTSSSFTSSGSSLGFGGINPSFVVEFDTHINAEDAPATDDHMAIEKNGDINHSTTNNLFSPVSIGSGGNIEDGQWHNAVFSWDPSINEFKVEFDGIVIGSITYDIINTIFLGNSIVYWGFTAGTGSLTNNQKIKLNSASYYTNCTITENITIGEPDPLTLSESVTNETCTAANGTIDLTAIGGNSGYQYSLNAGAMQSLTIFTGLSAGSYSATVVDAENCSTTLNTITVLDEPAPIINSLTVFNPLCYASSDGSITVNTTGGTPSINYAYNGGLTQSSNVLDNLPSGNYIVQVSDDNGCTVDMVDNLIDPPQLVIDYQSTPGTCYGINNASIDLTGSYGGTGNLQYSTDGGVTYLTNGVFSPLLPGLYDVQIKDDNGCEAISAGTVLEPTEVVFSHTVVNPSCPHLNNGEIIINASGGAGNYVYIWRDVINGNQIVSLPLDTLVQTSIGVNNPYGDTLFVLDANGCSSDTVYVMLTNPVTPTIDNTIINPLLCYGDTDASIEVVSVLADSFAIHTFPIVNNNSSTATFSTTPLFNNLPAGTFRVYVNDVNNCRDSADIIIVIPDQILIDPINDTTVCIGGTASFLVNTVGGTGNIDMYLNYIQGANPFLIAPVNDSIVNFYGLDANGCSTDTLDVQVKLHEPINITVSPNATICLNDTANIQAFASGGLQPPSYIYNWSNGLADLSSHNVSPTSTSTYTLNISDTCETPSQNEVVTVFVNPLPVVDFTYDIISGCSPLNISFIDLNYDPNKISSSWDFDIDNPAIFVSSDHDTTSFSYSIPGIYGVSLIIENSFGCFDTAYYRSIIEVYDNPNANFIFSPSEPSLLSSFVEFFNTSTNDSSQFSWSINDNIFSSTQENISFEFPTDSLATYNVCLQVVSINGCIDSLCKTITIKDDFIIYTPNAFSPNDDSRNDTFYPILNGHSDQSFKLYIFNRWGELVFNSFHIQNEWNGKGLNGNNCKEGVYVWKLIIEDAINPSEKIYYGNVTLLR